MKLLYYMLGCAIREARQERRKQAVIDNILTSKVDDLRRIVKERAVYRSHGAFCRCARCGYIVEMAQPMTNEYKAEMLRRVLGPVERVSRFGTTHD